MVDIYISTNLPVKIPPEHILCHVVELNLLIQGRSDVEPLCLVQPYLKIFCIFNQIQGKNLLSMLLSTQKVSLLTDDAVFVKNNQHCYLKWELLGMPVPQEVQQSQ